MINKIYSIFDSKVEAYMPPLFFRTHGEAIRAFENAVAQEGSQFRTNASDYTLFHLGEYDDQNAIFAMEMTPTPLARAHEALARQTPKAA